ncbi:hypothetical protein QR90_05040 [Deinococcus radiopugnans]|uniref:Uncharacterized protein n=1 Tax=Deinococcus radiopugnans TaxID=57497 RepID=A0A0A7KJ66_9DEIO|nr:hypothetical protein [Deinococcus radiopugnans]AIZ44593.1 hypothetical protein QR90_05040 [Deinococcus radiopugnans]
MTNSYLDEEWMDSQARELTTLQQKLRENLDIITLAAGQLPNLVEQIRRLEQRERETHQAIEEGRTLSLQQFETARDEGSRFLEEYALDLSQRMEQLNTRMRTQQKDALEALSTQTLKNLEAHQEILKSRLDAYGTQRYGDLPARIQEIQQLAETFRDELTDDVEKLQNISAGISARLEPLELEQAETAAAVISLGTALDSQATHQNQALEKLEQTQGELQTRVDALREKLNQRSEQFRNQLNREGAEIRTQLAALEQHATGHSETMATLQETQELAGTHLASLQDELNRQSEQTEGRLSQLQEATSKQLMSLEGQVAQQGETLGTLQYTQGDMGTQLSSLQDALGQFRTEATAQLSALERSQAETGADVATLRLTLTGQAERQGEALETLREEQMSLGRRVTLQDAALTQHAHQVSSQIKASGAAAEKQVKELRAVLENQANQQARTVADLKRTQNEALEQVREHLKELEKQMREQAVKTDHAQEAATREVSHLRTQVLNVSNRLSGFVEWFKTSGAWKRLNGDPEA